MASDPGKCASYKAGVAAAHDCLTKISSDYTELVKLGVDSKLCNWLWDLGNFYFNQTTDITYKSPEFQNCMMEKDGPLGYSHEYNYFCGVGDVGELVNYPFHKKMAAMTELNASAPFKLPGCKPVPPSTAGSCNKCFEGIEYGDANTPATFAFQTNYPAILAAIKATVTPTPKPSTCDQVTVTTADATGLEVCKSALSCCQAWGKTNQDLYGAIRLPIS